ncbi:MAG: peptide MFS transporter [Bryobacterales bacterium]|nr:peptide MFS transporter [Bryobacterales bacterium]
MDRTETQQPLRHPKGLYVLFASEAWERFSFYSMLSMFTLYLRDTAQGFGWTEAEATSLYSWYLTFVYASPFIGGLLADRYFGYLRTTLIGAVFFVAGHFLLSFHSINIVYAALACLVVGNGLFKPNVSTMVGNLYPDGSPLKDRAFVIFYFGINVGAFVAPVTMEFVKKSVGFHPAFAVAGVGMVISLVTLYRWREQVRVADEPQVAPHGAAAESAELASVSEGRRVGALLVVFAISAVFWMAFHQNGSTLTYFANDNVDWDVSGIISNAINPGWILILAFPLVNLWGWLGRRGMEPSTPAKMTIGMLLTGLSFFVLYWAASIGEASVTPADPYAYKVSPAWLISSYGIVTLGELLLSPMGLSLVSKVAPFRLRGMMMGGWFVATAVGNKLTAIGVYWTRWPHSQFFALLGLMCVAVAAILAGLLKPLKRAMPGV